MADKMSLDHMTRTEIQFRLLRLLFSYPEEMGRVVQAGLTPEQFEEETNHRDIFTIFLSAYKQHKALPSVGILAGMVPSEERAKIMRELSGGEDEPRENLPLYIARLFEMWQKVSLLSLPDRIPDLLERTSNPDEVAAKLHREITRITTATKTREITTLGEGLAAQSRSWMEKGERMADDFIPTGWLDLDRKLDGGLRLGTVTAVCGRPGHGKSTVLANMALHASIYHDKKCCFLSVEMTPEKCLDRFRATLSVKLPGNTIITLSDIRTRRLLDDPKKLKRAKEIEQRVQDVPLTIIDASGVGPDELYSRIEEQVNAGVQAVFIDHFGLLQNRDGRRPQKEAEWAELSETVRMAARNLRVAIVMAVQLNRDIEKRPKDDRRPKLSDLRDTGKLEQDAEVIIGVYRESEDDQAADDHQFTLSLLKNRDGELGDVILAYDPKCLSLNDPGFVAA